jgi:hypothetical protein
MAFFRKVGADGSAPHHPIRPGFSPRVSDPRSQQLPPGPAVHRPLDGLQPIDLPLHRAITPALGQCRGHRCLIQARSPDAKFRSSAQPDPSALATHSASGTATCFRTIAANSAASSSASRNPTSASRSLSRSACSAASRSAARRRNSNDVNLYIGGTCALDPTLPTAFYHCYLHKCTHSHV